MTFEEGLLRVLHLLATETHLIIQHDMGLFFSSVFVSSEFSSANYVRTPEDEANLGQLNRVYEIRAEIEKIQVTLTAEHKGANQFPVSSGSYRRIFSTIQSRNKSVSELEKIAKDAKSLQDYSASARESILGAYRSCRESYLAAGALITIYNTHNPQHKLPIIHIPKEL
jgi:hypothetical protein